FNGSVQMGINGNSVTDFSLTNSTVQNAGNQTNQSGIAIKNLAGSVTLTNDTLQQDNKWPLRVQNYAGTVSMTVDNVTFNGIGKANVASADGFLFGLSTGAVSANITVQNSRFFNNHSFGSQIDSGSGPITVTYNNNDFGQTNGVAVTNGNTGGLVLTQSAGGSVNYTVSNNRFYNQDVLGIGVTESSSSTLAS